MIHILLLESGSSAFYILLSIYTFSPIVWMAHWKHSSYKPETHGHYQCRENDGDIKRHGPESPPGISESSKGFREMSTGLKALNKSSLKKMKMKMGS
ncbi:hypothetical protein QYF36_010413 [Acer negundo]|nr:hypothetical protein QYF36_010413 [Acer negundo]